MNIFVTGGAGFIGSHIAEHFASKNHDVYVVDKLTEYYSPQIKQKNISELETLGVKHLELDLAEDDLEQINDKIDAMVHCAAQPGIASSVSFAKYLKNNKVATHRLVEWCHNQSNTPFFINISSSSVYGLEATGDESSEPQPASDYGVTKLAAEQLALSRHRQGKLPAVSLRLFSVFGPRERPEKLFPKLIHAAETDTAFPLYEGSREHVRSFTYVADVVRAVAQVLENKDEAAGEIINIGTDKTRTTGEAIQAVEEAVGKEIKIDLQPPREGDQSKTSATIEKARKLLDWEPKTTLEAGVKEQVRWFQENNIHQLI